MINLCLRRFPWMCISEGSNYLLKLIPKYRRVGGERYILSRMVRIAPEGSMAEILFCRRCLSLYIPVVNSRMRSDDDIFSVECNGCHAKSIFKVEDIKSYIAGTNRSDDEAYKFGYYFG